MFRQMMYSLLIFKTSYTVGYICGMDILKIAQMHGERLIIIEGHLFLLLGGID
jgi:hypothetical protein